MLKSIQYMCGKHCRTSAPLCLCVCVCEGSVSHTYTLDLILLKSLPFFCVHLAFSVLLLIPPLVDISTHTPACPTLPPLYLYPFCWLSLSAACFIMSAENAALDFSHSGKVNCMQRRLLVKGCSRDLLKALWSFLLESKLVNSWVMSD